MPRNLQVMISVSLGFFFVTATTFTSLGYVLFSMVSELGWSEAAAGASFSLLGLACGLSSPLPAMLMKSIGTRWTMTLGGLVLASGFLLAAIVQSIATFFVATSLMGVGFSLIAPAPAVFLIATWFPDKAPRYMGYYFMCGALGGVAGPLVVGAIVGFTGSWRMHWLYMAGASVVVAAILFAAVRDAVRVESIEQVRHAGKKDTRQSALAGGWTVKQATSTPTFLFIVLAMITVQTVVTTMHSVLVSHVASLGSGPAPGAWAMSLLALMGTAAKGISGVLTERIAPRFLLTAGLALQALAMILLCVTASTAWALVFAMIFGVGWGFSWLSAHVLLLRYFGSAIAGDLVAMATMATTFAVLGPLSAGGVADLTGSFRPIFIVFAAMLGLSTIVTALFLRAPSTSPARAAEEQEESEAVLVPAE